MRRKRWILPAGLILATLGIMLGARWWLGKPWYQGKPLSVWLEDYGPGPSGYKPSPKTDEALRHLGPAAVPCLLRLLHTTNSISALKMVRKSAVAKSAIAPAIYFGPPPKATNPGVQDVQDPLLKLVEKHTPFRFVRVTVPASWQHWKAYVAFQALGPLGKPAIPDLVKLAQDSSGTSLYPSIGGMTNISLVAKLADNSGTYVAEGDPPNFHGSTLRRNTNAFLVDGEIAAWSLAAIGADAVPSLMQVLANPSPRLRQRAAEALGLSGAVAEPAVPLLVENLRDPEREIRSRAADALGWIGKQPTLTVPALIEALKDAEMAVNCAAANSLGRFRDRATNAVPALLTNFSSRDYRTKQSAAIALSKISRETSAREVIPVLVQELSDSRAGFRNTALLTLSQMQDVPDLVIPPIIEAMDDNDRMVRNNAIRMLGRFGAAAKAALPKLIALATNQDTQVRTNAVAALERIEPSWKASSLSGLGIRIF